MREKILVTGGTGFLGKWAVPLLREKFDVFVISRKHGEIRGDLTRWCAGINTHELKEKSFSALLHMGGLYDLRAPVQDCFLQNISGTGNVLRLASELEIPIFINTSSVAAAINSRFDQVRGMDLDLHRPFPDPYSESKARAEKVIQNWNGPIMFRLNLRLGVLVGDSEQGRIERIDGPYHAAEALRSIRAFVSRWPVALPLPGSEETVLPLVPVDACARAIVKLTEWAICSGEVGYKSLHLTPTRGVGVRDFYRSVLRHLHLRPKGLILTGRLNQQTVKKIANWAAHLPEEELNYLMNFPNYDTADTEALLGSDWCPEFPDYERVFWSGYEKFVSNR